MSNKLSYDEILTKLPNVHKRGNALVAQCPVCGDEDHLYINRDGEKRCCIARNATSPSRMY